MVDIIHRVGMKSASLDEVYAALTTIEGLAGWWTTDTKGDTEVGGVIAFRFASGGFDMEVVETNPGEGLLWKVVDGPAEWIGTTVRWTLKQEDNYVIVLFAHAGWRGPVGFMYHCSTRWARFLVSLKQLVETGTGAPHPRDL